MVIFVTIPHQLQTIENGTYCCIVMCRVSFFLIVCVLSYRSVLKCLANEEYPVDKVSWQSVSQCSCHNLLTHSANSTR